MEAMELYRQWLKDFADDADTVADLKAIADDPKEIEDRFTRNWNSVPPACAACSARARTA